MALLLRCITREDLQAIARLEVLFEQDSLSTRTLANIIRSNPECMMVAEEEGEVVGYILVRRAKRTGRLHIDSIIVDPAQRGKGIGRAMMEHVVEQHGHEELRLVVAQGNHAALRLYQSLGFAITKKLAEYYGDGSDAYRMVRPGD